MMNVLKKQKGFGLIGTLIAIAVFAILSMGAVYYKKIQKPEISEENYVLVGGNDPISLYPGLEWNEAQKTQREYRDYGENINTDRTVLMLSGYKIESRPTKIDPIDFYDYYDAMLRDLGWKHDITQDADGPSGSIWVYIKGENHILFGKKVRYSDSFADGPPQCPCTYTFFIFWDDPRIRFGNEESKIDTSNWKTYHNEESGFELKYPPLWDTWSAGSGAGYFGVNSTPEGKPPLRVVRLAKV